MPKALGQLSCGHNRPEMEFYQHLRALFILGERQRSVTGFPKVLHCTSRRLDEILSAMVKHFTGACGLRKFDIYDIVVTFPSTDASAAFITIIRLRMATERVMSPVLFGTWLITTNTEEDNKSGWRGASLANN